MSHASQAVPPSINGWDLYPEGITSFDPFATDATKVRERLNKHAAATFSNKDVSVDFIDALAARNYKSNHREFCREEDVLAHVETSDLPDLRIISILRKFSLSPLMISRELLLKILKFHNVGPGFLDLLPAFRTVDELSEKGNSLWSAQRYTHGGIEVCYNFKYMERNDHSHGQPWSERQIGVYHSFGGKSNAVMVLIHANPSTKAHSRLQQVFSCGQYQQQSSTSPFLLHALILSSYLDNWRSYLQELGSWCLTKENQFLTVDLKHPSLCFQELQELRDLESRLLIASGILQSTMTVIESIEACCRGLLEGSATVVNAMRPAQSGTGGCLPSELQSLSVLGVKCKGYSQSVDLIQRRINVVIGLLADGLSQQSQKTANSIADSSYALTQKSVNDSYIVKVVTVITVVYLPMQGVATFFGMNLTSFSEQSHKLGFASNWWLFLITAGPLTILTLGGLWTAWALEKRRKGNRQQVTDTA